MSTVIPKKAMKWNSIKKSFKKRKRSEKGNQREKEGKFMGKPKKESETKGEEKKKTGRGKSEGFFEDMRKIETHIQKLILIHSI